MSGCLGNRGTRCFLCSQMENFYLDHYQDAFGSVSRLLHENFSSGPKRRKGWSRGELSVGWTTDFLKKLRYRKCEYSHLSDRVVAYDDALREALHDVPPALLCPLLQEELRLSGRRRQLCDGATGGALAHAALRRGGVLLLPTGPDRSRLKVQRVSLRSEGGSTWLDPSGIPPCMKLSGPVQQISCSTLLSDCCVAVRSHYMCGVWRFKEEENPKILQVIQTRQPVTCITASMLQVRCEDTNLYFNASSPWRWCEFSAHPRVMLYADRTGMELTDTRAADASSYTLFRIGQSPQCRSGERVMLARYLADAHPFHHLVTTQYSAYIMDERFPALPMLKWDHMMQAPPLFAQVLPGHASSVGGASSPTKVVIGSQSSQEIVMLQYSGGSAEPCVSLGPPQELLRPGDTLDQLPVQLPHRTLEHRRRLTLPAADRRRRSSAPPPPPRAAGQEVAPPGEEVNGSGVASPTTRTTQTWSGGLVEETPERERVSGSSSCEEEEEEERGGGRRRRRQFLGLEVVENEEDDGGGGGGGGMESGAAAASGAAGEDGATAAASSDWSDRTAPPSSRAAGAWRRWFQQLLRLRRRAADRTRDRTRDRDRTGPAGRRRLRAKLRGFKLSAAGREPITEDRLQSLRRDLGDSMASGALLLHGATYLPHLHLPEVPDPVRPESWPDALSQRLGAAWQGEEQWRRWWQDHLGLNRKEQREALRVRRRKEKAERRSRRSLDPGGSRGWSSAASQRGWSDSDVSQSARWSEPGSGLSQSACWSEPGSPRSGVSQSGRWSEPGSPRSGVSQSARWSEPGTPRSGVSQSARWSEPGTPRSGVSQSARWSEPGTPRSGVSRASQLQQWSPEFSRLRRTGSGSLPDPKEGTPGHLVRLLEVEDLEPLIPSSQRSVGGLRTPRPSSRAAGTWDPVLPGQTWDPVLPGEEEEVSDGILTRRLSLPHLVLLSFQVAMETHLAVS
ncbi:unnamed protein product [Merluccius merluccius]